MTYVVALISATVTGALLALAFRAMTGIDHMGIMIALAIIGGGLQAAALILGYMRYLRSREQANALRDRD